MGLIPAVVAAFLMEVKSESAHVDILVHIKDPEVIAINLDPSIRLPLIALVYLQHVEALKGAMQTGYKFVLFEGFVLGCPQCLSGGKRCFIL